MLLLLFFWGGGIFYSVCMCVDIFVTFSRECSPELVRVGGGGVGRGAVNRVFLPEFTNPKPNCIHCDVTDLIHLRSPTLCTPPIPPPLALFL